MIATQIYGLKKELNEDLPGTVRKLHELGFEGIEPLVMFKEKQGKASKHVWSFEALDEAWSIMKDLGMAMPSAQIGAGYGWFLLPSGKIAEGIIRMNKSYGTRDFVLSGMFSSDALAKRWAKTAKKVAELVKPYGCRILYHNHSDEFKKNSRGETALEVFFRNAGSDVLLQLDIGWAGYGGDESDIVLRYMDRIGSLHLKDFYPEYRFGYDRKTVPDEAFSPIGEGAIRTKEILGMRDILPNFEGLIIIDQDRSRGPMLDELAVGISNVKSMLGE